MQQVLHQKIRLELLKERHIHVRGVRAFRVQPQKNETDDQRHQNLECHLHAGGQSEVTHPAHLGDVVVEADRAEAHQSEQGNPDIGVAQVRPQQRGNRNGTDNQ